ncbi:hypothetical protein AB0F07_36275 [Streptomyces fructofermentans]
MKELGAAYAAVEESVGRDAPDEVLLEAAAWGEVIAVAAGLARTMVVNDLQAAALLQE